MKPEWPSTSTNSSGCQKGLMNGPNEFIAQVNLSPFFDLKIVDDPEPVIAKQWHGEGLFFLSVVCSGS